MTIKPGTLYGIGVGPGDPDLLTVKAIHVLQKVDIVYTAASTKKRLQSGGQHCPGPHSRANGDPRPGLSHDQGS